MELSDLVGLHKLSGCDMSNGTIDKYGSLENCEVINFVLDGKTYTATEDPDDGYRSHMKDIIESDIKINNLFPEQGVLGIMRTSGKYEGDDDILDLLDLINGKIILSVGTANTDDYYPSFVAYFMPENMSINTK